MLLEIGKKTALAAGLPEGVILHIDNSGPMLIYNFSTPSPEEIASFKAGVPAEFRLSRVGGVLFLLAKVGSVAWADAPYAPQIEPEFSLQEVEDGLGYALQLVLIDRTTGIVKGLRLVGLSTSFSRAFYRELMADMEKTTTRAEHYANVDKVFAAYSTNDLIKFSLARYKIRQ